MKGTRSLSFNIVICPPKEISQKAILMSKELKKHDGLFVLDNTKFFPHITIYQVQLPVENVLKVRAVLRAIAAQTKSFRSTSLTYRQSSEGYIDIAYKKSKTVEALQKKVINLLNPLRKGLLQPKDKARLSTFSKRQQRNLKRYGFRSVGTDFVPHLTFTKLPHSNGSALSGLKPKKFSFVANRIGLFYLGEHGTCRKKIDFFDLTE